MLEALLRQLSEAAVAGIATARLERLFLQLLRAHPGAEPAFKGLFGYPGAICTSVNEEVAHGVPGGRVLRRGDLLKIDAGIVRNGYYADLATLLVVGGPGAPPRQALVDCAKQALLAAIAAAQPGNAVGDVSAAGSAVIAKHGFSVVLNYAGHGIGTELHTEPFVLPGVGTRLEAGMCLCLEPILCDAYAANQQGEPDLTRPLGAVNAVYKHGTHTAWVEQALTGAASYEAMVLITADGAEVLGSGLSG